MAPDSANDRPEHGPAACCRARLSRARWSILWERLWPALASIATAAGLFLAVSWLGLWLALPPLGRAIGLFAVLRPRALPRAVPLFLVRLPSTQ